ncbi:hypothetical protein [Chryseobacterium sp. IT-36CA2]|uniref:hypothetical protein n=1 Tax=Chryseobacterium sp. IT-36CA2 TaxID=3026460 RepID=UPI0039E19F38
MKKLLLPDTLLVFLHVYSQVGINTTTTKKTLHINGSLKIGRNTTRIGLAGILGRILALTSNYKNTNYQYFQKASFVIL